MTERRSTANDLRTTFDLAAGERLEHRDFAYRGDAVIAVDTVGGLTPTTPTSYAVDVSPSQVYLDGDVGMAAPPTNPPSTPLPKTGSNTDLLTLTGLIAIAVGVLMLVGAAVLQRRRYGLELPPTE